MKKEYIIIDWSSHLPGPFACYQLASLGFKVIKPLKKDKLMPFQKISNSRIRTLGIFNAWFNSFNQNKELVYYESENELIELFHKADGVITNRDKLPCSTNAVVTQIVSSHKDSHPRHDINALAYTNLLSFFIESNQPQDQTNLKSMNLPVLPWAGIELANKVVQNHLKQLLTGESKISVALDSSIEKLSECLLPKSATLETKSFLHTGAFPCYRLYRLKNNKWVALGAVEEKYWNQFCNYFNLELKPEDRFDLTGRIQQKIEGLFSELSSIDKETRGFCLSTI